MRQVALTSREFKFYVYRGIATSSCENAHEWECQVRLMRALKDPKLTEDVPVTEEERKEAAAANQPSFTFKRLSGGRETATFMLEEDEWAMLKDRMEKGRVGLAAIAAEEYEEMLKKLDNPTEVKKK